MMTAKEARYKSEEFYATSVQEIINTIDRACERGEFYITLYTRPSDFEISKLRDLGYDIELNDYSELIKISW